MIIAIGGVDAKKRSFLNEDIPHTALRCPGRHAVGQGVSEVAIEGSDRFHVRKQQFEFIGIQNIFGPSWS